jgi:hypothetical protein
MSTRWILNLSATGQPDISTVYASYVLAGTLIIGLLLGATFHWWPFLVAILAAGFQLPLLFVIALEKIRTLPPPPIAHAEMFPNPEPLADIGWLKAFGGFIITAATIGAYLVFGP